MLLRPAGNQVISICSMHFPHLAVTGCYYRRFHSAAHLRVLSYVRLCSRQYDALYQLPLCRDTPVLVCCVWDQLRCSHMLLALTLLTGICQLAAPEPEMLAGQSPW